MSTAKCFQCGGSATADTFEQARSLINHAVGLSRGIKCGDAYGAVKDVSVTKTFVTPPETKKEITKTIKEEEIIIKENKEPKINETILEEEEKVKPKTEKTKTTRKKFKDIKS